MQNFNMRSPHNLKTHGIVIDYIIIYVFITFWL